MREEISLKAFIMNCWLRLIVLALGSVGASQAVVVFKEDFEYRSDYGYVPPGPNALYPEGKYTVDRNPVTSHPAFASFGGHGTGAGKMLIVNGVANSVVWQRKVSGAIAWQQYVIRLYAASAYPANPATLQFTVNNTAVGNPLNLPAATGSWRLLNATVTASSTVLTIRVVDLNSAAGGNDFVIDDFEVVEVSTQRSLLRENFEASSQYRYVAPAYNALFDEGTATVDNNPAYSHQYFTYFADHTGDAGNMLIANGVANSTVWGTVVNNLVGGTPYTVSVHARSAYPVNPARLAIRIQGVTYGSLTLFGPGAEGWVEVLAGFTAIGNSALVEVVDTVSGAGGNDFAIDDFELRTGTSTDTTPPQILSLAVAAQNSTTAVVTWNTNEFATTLVEYGVATACTGAGQFVDAALVVSPHQAVIQNLTPNTTYCFTATSRDQVGNSSSQAVSFQTPPNAAAGCDVTVEVVKGTARVNGNRVTGYVIAYAKSGAWEQYEASVEGEMYFADPSLTTHTRLGTGSSQGFKRLLNPANGSGDPNNSDSYVPPTGSPGWSFPAELEPRGPGFYYVKGSGWFKPVPGPCETALPKRIPEFVSPYRQILRPDAPVYKQGSPTQLWWLGGDGTKQNGQYSEWTIIVAGRSNDPDHDNTFQYRQWVYEQPQPGYVKNFTQPADCSASLCKEVFLRALRADANCSESTVNVYNSIDGFKSDPLVVRKIRRPYRTIELESPTTFPFDPEGEGVGYRTVFKFNVEDNCSTNMYNYRIESNLTNIQRSPPDSNWLVSDRLYNVGAEDYVSAFIEIAPGQCGTELATGQPLPCIPIPEFHEPVQQNSPLVVQGSQTWRLPASLDINSGGVSVRYNDFFMYRDHGAIGGPVTPYPPNQ